MIATTLCSLLNKGDRVGVSNVTGREAMKVSIVSQQYCDNIVGGWALGKDQEIIRVPGGRDIRVFGQFEDLMKALPARERPNKVIVYSPPEAVYGDVKEVVENGEGTVETIFVITEHVSVEVTAKLRHVCNVARMDIIGCNTLGLINARAGVRVGAVGGDTPAESFIPGSATIISNSGNMVNTIAGYLQSAGLGVSFGISTGKDPLILTPLRDFLVLAERDKRTKVIVLYVEPGGTYERDAIELMTERKYSKPLLVFVAGAFAEGRNISLGHAGAVVEGRCTSASDKMRLFDEYLGVAPFDPADPKAAGRSLRRTRRGLRATTLHALVPAAQVLMEALRIKPDFKPLRPLALNPWIVELGALAAKLPERLALRPGRIPSPYDKLLAQQLKGGLGRVVTRQPLRHASHASANDGATPRIYGYSLPALMQRPGSFAYSVLLSWLGSPPAHEFETRLFEMCLTASITNGPGTISAQGAKLAASAGNEPNTAMMATLGAIGSVHGGNGKEAARFLIRIFRDTGLTDPYDRKQAPDLDQLAQAQAADYQRRKLAAKDAGVEIEKVPCLGHPVFNQEAVNYDPRERVISRCLEEEGWYNVFLDFYHRLTRALMSQGVTTKVHAVNVDAALACVCLGCAWPLLVEKKITVERAADLPFVTFALGRVAGGAAEYLDHRDFGTDMDMRVPVSECKALTRPRD
ncbi:MAG TPA: citrate/2-methylcitrate synthase [Candidatus Paceibacterota bacterium]|nr:citrate/2-methylcitrate synthase [Verrucomicrobiota bacterium]HSA09056.1 citrate/2-methylcitrate synthase [Candidatus Paceibacterota bacterium]